MFLAQNYTESIRLLEELVKTQNVLQLECLELLLEVYKAQNLLESAESVYRLFCKMHLEIGRSGWSLEQCICIVIPKKR
ncbi:hypothetical protein [uncultured Helicobacter sp.]|uniref:hypothetical protein n=1 Tax=uncultured Helicobacter sp. TaxID=175537 RepID=UPI0026346895|nr:hypothetical protein [uncultured Helicobacter sp.]